MLLHRLLFEDVKARWPDHEVWAAFPRRYLPLVEDHPHLDRVVAVEDLTQHGTFDLAFDTTHRCGQHEHAMLRDHGYVDRHRADIWAEEVLGIRLLRHDAHVRLADPERAWADRTVREEAPAGPSVGFAPYSSHPSKDWGYRSRKNEELVAALRARGIAVFVLHDEPARFEGAWSEVVDLRRWMALVATLDAVVTVASATFCLASCLRKPTVAIFGCEDLDVFARYFPECVPVQRRRRPDTEAWAECPCWDARRCAYKEHGVYPPACLEDVTVAEVLVAVDEALAIARRMA